MIVTPKDIEERIQVDLNSLVNLFRSNKLDANRAICGIAAITALKDLQAELARRQKKLDQVYPN